MKTLIILIIILLSFAQVQSQITWEGRFDANLKAVQLHDGTVKYLSFDHKEEILTIFNSDNTLWESIPLQVPKGHRVDNIELLVGSDSSMNILYTCYYFDPQNIENYDGIYDNLVLDLNILDDNGVYLLTIPRIMDYKLLTSDNQKKLLIYSSESSGFNDKQFIDIYSFNK